MHLVPWFEDIDVQNGKHFREFQEVSRRKTRNKEQKYICDLRSMRKKKGFVSVITTHMQSQNYFLSKFPKNIGPKFE